MGQDYKDHIERGDVEIRHPSPIWRGSPDIYTIRCNDESLIPEIRDLIENNDMEFNTDHLPEFSLAAVGTHKSGYNGEIVGYMGGHRKYGSNGHKLTHVVGW